MVENEKVVHQKDIGNYSDGSIICLKSSSVECVSSGNKYTQIVKIKENETQKAMYQCMVCSKEVIFIF